MIKTTLMIPVYNEADFIERTLQTVVGEADQIIISDNASTDGTSKICEDFARKYPEIEYTRQIENIGGASFDFCLSQAKGEYIMTIGGHDMISKNCIRNLSCLLDDNPDAVLAFPRNAINLNRFYSFTKIYLANEFGDTLSSPNPYIRVENIVNKLSDCTMWYGLHRIETLKSALKENAIFEKIYPDHVFLTNLANKGRFIIDDNSTFYRLENRKYPYGWEGRCKSVIQAQRNIVDATKVNPFEWPLSIICGTYEIAKEMQLDPDAPLDFDRGILQDIVKRFAFVPGVTPSLENIISMPEKKALVDEVMDVINKMQSKRNK